MTKTNTEHNRYILTKALVKEEGAPRYVVGAEDRRVSELVDETYVDPYHSSSALMRMGRSLLFRTGLATPRKPKLVERPYLETSQHRQQEHIADELKYARILLKENYVTGVDDAVVDTYLNIRSDDSIVPPLFRRLHAQAEQTLGKELTFIDWAGNMATDEQLLNLLQWHDTYLKDLDENPEFQERIKNIKRQYKEGLEIVKDTHLVHPNMFADTSIIDSTSIQHASPFSPVIAGAHAFLLRGGVPEIHIRPDTDDQSLFHEMTHLAGGLMFQFDEGMTDRIAIHIFNATHDESEHKEEKDSVYHDQIRMLDTLKILDKEAFSPWEVSRVYAASNDPIANTIELVGNFDDRLGFPLLLHLTKESNQLLADNLDKYAGSLVRQAAQIMLRENVELAGKVLLSEGNGNLPQDIPEFLKRVISLRENLSQDQFNVLVFMAKEIHDLQQQIQ